MLSSPREAMYLGYSQTPRHLVPYLSYHILMNPVLAWTNVLQIMRQRSLAACVSSPQPFDAGACDVLTNLLDRRSSHRWSTYEQAACVLSKRYHCLLYPIHSLLLRCLLRLEESAHSKPQISHVRCFSPVWVRRWVAK